jgi:hypothetical protein
MVRATACVPAAVLSGQAVVPLTLTPCSLLPGYESMMQILRLEPVDASLQCHLVNIPDACLHNVDAVSTV